MNNEDWLAKPSPGTELRCDGLIGSGVLGRLERLKLDEGRQGEVHENGPRATLKGFCVGDDWAHMGSGAIKGERESPDEVVNFDFELDAREKADSFFELVPASKPPFVSLARFTTALPPNLLRILGCPCLLPLSGPFRALCGSTGRTGGAGGGTPRAHSGVT